MCAEGEEEMRPWPLLRLALDKPWGYTFPPHKRLAIGLSVQLGAQTVIHLPGKPCAVTQFLYLGILLPFHPIFFFFLYFSLSLLKSLSLSLSPLIFLHITIPTPYSLIFFTFYWHMVDLCFGPATSFFLELLVIALCSSPVACWTPSDLGRGAHLPVPYLFITVQGFSRQEYWSGLPFPPPVDHVLSELFTMTFLAWVALHGIAHSFTELHKPFHHDKTVIHEGMLSNCDAG